MDNPNSSEDIGGELAVIAISAFEAGADRQAVMETLTAVWLLAGAPAGVFHDASVAVAHLPEPADESAEKRESMGQLRNQHGIHSAEAVLLARLQAREALQILSEVGG